MTPAAGCAVGDIIVVVDEFVLHLGTMVVFAIQGLEHGTSHSVQGVTTSFAWLVGPHTCIDKIVHCPSDGSW